MAPALHCPNCRAPVLPAAPRCRACGCPFTGDSNARPLTLDELGARAASRAGLVVAILVVLGLAAAVFALWYQGMKGLAGR